MNEIEEGIKEAWRLYRKDGKTHEEFLKDVKHFTSLPAQTCRALGPESEEDISMYANCEEGEK